MNNKKAWILIILGCVAFLNGAISQYLGPAAKNLNIDLWFLFLGALLLFAWYHIDSEEIHYKRSTLLNVSVIALAIIALPFYFFRSRGFKKGLVYTSLFLLAIVSTSVLGMVGASLVYYGIQS